MHVLNKLSSINNMFIFGENCDFLNHDLDYQLNMKMDQSTRAIWIIYTCKNAT